MNNNSYLYSELELLSNTVEEICNRTQNKRTIYTAIIGEHDELQDPEVITKDFDYICFTDLDDLESDVWSIVKINFTYRDPRRLAKVFKVLVHKVLSCYSSSVWIDASIKQIADVSILIGSLLDEKDVVAFFPHPKRNCLYQEAEVVLKTGRESEEIVSKQIKRYRTECYPENNGLIKGGIIFRNNNSRIVNELMESWWNEIDSGSVRDQISFNYCAHIIGYSNKYFSGAFEEFFEIKPHKIYVYHGTGYWAKVKAKISQIAIVFAYKKKLFVAKLKDIK
jgi:hypothetical protein